MMPAKEADMDKIELTAEMRSFVARRVASGHYMDESDVVRAALRLLMRRDEAALERLRAELDVGLRDLAAGRYSEFDPTEFDLDESDGLAAE
jgi:putative addiction module CopG family antidote